MATENKISFEAAITRLEEIIRQLERGDAPLETSLTLYEEGVGLIKSCTGMLDEATLKVKLLTKQQDGTYDERDFEKTE